MGNRIQNTEWFISERGENPVKIYNKRRLLSYEHIIGGVESNRRNFELIFIEFFELFFTFQIIHFRIESNEFRTNPASVKFDSTL